MTASDDSMLTVARARMSGGRPDAQLEVAGLDEPGRGRDVVDRERAAVQRQDDPRGLPRRQVNLAERLQLLLRAGQGADRVVNVELDDLRPRPLAHIGDGQRHVTIDPGAGDDRLGVLEAGVAEPVPEAEPRRHVSRVVEAIADVEALAVLHLGRVVGEVRGRRELAAGHGEALGEASARFDVAEQDVNEGGAAGLPAEVGLDQRRRTVGPADLDRCAVAQHRGGARIGRGDHLDQVVMSAWQAQMFASVSLGLVAGR